MALIDPIRQTGARFSAVFFDFDGTLVDSEHRCAELFSRAARSVGQTIDVEASSRLCLGRSWPDICDLAAAEFPKLANARQALWEEVEREVADNDDAFGKPIADSVEGLVHAARFVPIAVVSGSFRSSIETALGALGVSELVDVIVAAEDYNNGKPSPEPYLLAASRMGHDPTSVAAIEDSPVGVRSALAAGCSCVATGEPSAFEPSALVVKSLRDDAVWRFLGLPKLGAAVGS